MGAPLTKVSWNSEGLVELGGDVEVAEDLPGGE
jgi:hypothetical protein